MAVFNRRPSQLTPSQLDGSLGSVRSDSIMKLLSLPQLDRGLWEVIQNSNNFKALPIAVKAKALEVFLTLPRDNSLVFPGVPVFNEVVFRSRSFLAGIFKGDHDLVPIDCAKLVKNLYDIVTNNNLSNVQRRQLVDSTVGSQYMNAILPKDYTC